MEETEIIEISEQVLNSLFLMGSEGNNQGYEGQLIFPNKIQKGKGVKRISEQELRQLFIEKFNENHKNLYYSIETPTIEKYKFKDKVKVDSEEGQSALVDMSVFKSGSRKLNIEFKYGNAPLKNIEKDVLKLMYEKQNGAFIFLLKNTDRGTLNNNSKTGVLEKLSSSFDVFKKHWKGDKDKFIQLIILSLQQKKNKGIPFLIHRTIRISDLGKPKKKIFSIGDIGSLVIAKEPKEGEWVKLIIDKH